MRKLYSWFVRLFVFANWAAKAICTIAVAIIVVACSATPSLDSGSAALASTPAGSSLATGIANFNTSINNALASPDAKALFQLPACGGSAYLDAAYKLAAPLAGASASDSQNEAVAMAGMNTLCAAPPTDAAQAATTALSGYVAVKSALAAVAPAAATATVPAAAPAAPAPSAS